MPERLRVIILVIIIAVVGILIAAGLSFFSQYLGTRVSGVALSNAVMGGALTGDLAVGSHNLEFRGRTKDGNDLRDQVAFVIKTAETQPGPDSGPPPAPPRPPLGEVAYQFDTYISETAVPIFSAYELSGPVDASLTVRVRTHTEPAVEVSAEATYVYPTAERHNPAVPASYKGNWVLRNIQTTGGGASVTAPTVTALADDTTSARKSYITLTSSQRYRATVTIEGAIVEGDVAPVLLPRFHSAPFVGPKKIVVVKGRYADEPLPKTTNAKQNAPYGANDAAITDILGRIETAYEHMSNGKVPIEYEVREATFTTSGLTANMPGNAPGKCPTGHITQRLLANMGISPEHYTEEIDLLVVSVYESSATRLVRELGCKLPDEEGSGRATWVSFKDPLIQALPHGLGHGLGMNHVYWSSPCTTGISPDPRTPSIEHVYTSRRPTPACAVQSSTYGHAMGWAWTPAVYYHQMDRASVGWLTEGQVELVTTSGVYDLYSERNDSSASPDDPLILQVPVEFEGYGDFVYLSLANQGAMTADRADPAMLANALQGVRLTAAGGLAGAGRTSDTKQGSDISHVWYGPGIYDEAIPIGGFVHLNWPNTNVRIEVVSVTREEDRTHAKIKVTMNDVPAPATAVPLPAPAGPQPTPTPGFIVTVSPQPTLRWQAVEGAARYHVRVYSVFAGDRSLASEVMVDAPATEARVPGPLKDLGAHYDYVWNVQAIDAEGNGGQWSALQRLNVQ